MKTKVITRKKAALSATSRSRGTEVGNFTLAAARRTSIRKREGSGRAVG